MRYLLRLQLPIVGRQVAAVTIQQKKPQPTCRLERSWQPRARLSRSAESACFDRVLGD
jgi:hypothetical protein